VGSFTVFANASGKSGSATVTVTPGALTAIVVSPSTATVAVGSTRQFTAAGEDAKKNPVSITPQWAVSGGGTIDGSGLFTAASQGVWKLYANASGKSGTADVQVTGGGGGTVASVFVEPPQTTVRSDQTVDFKAIGRDATGNSLGEVNVSWSVDNGNIDAAGVFTPQKTGSWKVTATYQQLTGAASVSVTPGPIASLDIEPRQATLKVGEKKKYAHFANDSKGNAITGAQVTFVTDPVLGDFASDATFTAKTEGSGKVKASATFLGATEQAESLITVTKAGGSGNGGGPGPSGDLLSQPFFLIGVIAAAVAIAAVAAFAAMRRKKKRPPQAQGPWDHPQWGGPPQY
jgi:hypothetical protein